MIIVNPDYTYCCIRNPKGIKINSALSNYSIFKEAELSKLANEIGNK